MELRVDIVISFFSILCIFFLGCDVTSDPSEEAQHHSLHH